MNQRIGLIDVDKESRGRSTFPNLSLMKVSAYHKSIGDEVGWYTHASGHYDRVYLSKVFGEEYSKDYTLPIDADKIIRGGSGYAISVSGENEGYCKELDPPLPYCVDHIMPDYELYGIKNTAYGFLTKGCPRGCPFCHCAEMQGRVSYTFAPLQEFWSGQKNIVLLDPNITANRDWEKHFCALRDSKAHIDFSQGLDARLTSLPKIELLNEMKWKRIHFAWDRAEENLIPDFERITLHLKGLRKQTVSAYVLTNFNSTHQQNIDRVMFLRSLNIQPYVMIYRKEKAPQITRRLQRWCNWPAIFWKYDSFGDYCRDNYKTGEGLLEK